MTLKNWIRKHLGFGRPLVIIHYHHELTEQAKNDLKAKFKDEGWDLLMLPADLGMTVVK